jgi:hypothetical protein
VTTTTDPIALTNAVLPGAGYLHLNRPVPVPCRLTLSPDTDRAESVAVYLCSDDEIPVVQLGYGSPFADRVHTAYAHAAGSPVRVEDEVPRRGQRMIHVAIVCAHSSPFAGRFCRVLEDNIPPETAADWYAATLAEHAWTVDGGGLAYCPRHNPANRGAEFDIVQGEYRPLGDSGWEARLPESYSVMEGASARIEVRQHRGDGDE